MHVRSLSIAAALILGVFSISFSQENIALKLGYPEDARLLIIHADDLGVSHSENVASLKAIDEGSVNSASVMMPTPWVLEVAQYAKAHPDTHDLGLHLTLSSEWKHYKWGPVSSTDMVPGLVDEHGYFRDACSTELNTAEVVTELRAQIDRAYAMGLTPTHLDSHMGCLFQSAELIAAYLRVGQLYSLPVLVVDEMLSPELREQYDVRVVMDAIYTISPGEYQKGPEAYYTDVIKGLKPGLSTLLIHTAYDDHEMQGITVDHPEWGSAWRQKDLDFFTGQACRELLHKENITLVTWRQLKEAFYGEK